MSCFFLYSHCIGVLVGSFEDYRVNPWHASILFVKGNPNSASISSPCRPRSAPSFCFVILSVPTLPTYVLLAALVSCDTFRRHTYI